MPKAAEPWSLTSLREKLIKIRVGGEPWPLRRGRAPPDRCCPLLKSFKRAILTSNPPGICRMSLSSPFGDAPSTIPVICWDGVDHDYRTDQISDRRTF